MHKSERAIRYKGAILCQLVCIRKNGTSEPTPFKQQFEAVRADKQARQGKVSLDKEGAGERGARNLKLDNFQRELLPPGLASVPFGFVSVLVRVFTPQSSGRYANSASKSRHDYRRSKRNVPRPLHPAFLGKTAFRQHGLIRTTLHRALLHGRRIGLKSRQAVAALIERHRQIWAQHF